MSFPPPPVPPILSDHQIQVMAENFRQTYWPQGTLPIDAELIAENLGISIDPVAGLREETGIDATLSADCSLLYIDLEYFRNPRQENRVRFSVAHELGHLVLHQQLFAYYQENMPKDVYEWARMMRWLHDTYELYYEHQADEFAGCLLVPAERLASEIQPFLEQIKKTGYGFDADTVRSVIAPKVQRVFMVAPTTIEIRLRKYKIVTNNE